MIKSNYYFLFSSLPKLSFEPPLVMSFHEAVSIFNQSFTEEDNQVLKDFLIFIDVQNLFRYFKDQPFDPRGNLSKSALEGAIQRREHFSSKIFEFFDKYSEKEQRIKNFVEIIIHFLQKSSKSSIQFIAQYFDFERKLRILLSILRSKRINRNVLEELSFEDLKDPSISKFASAFEAKTEILEKPLVEARAIYEKYFDNPILLFEQLIKLRFNFIEEILPSFSFFGVDRLLAFLMELYLVENWFKLDETKGKEKLKEWMGA